MIDLKEIRNKKGLTQQELADRVGVNRTVITRLETEVDYKPSVPTAQKIADILGLDWTKFF